jgi:hypothetical protein
MALDGEKRGEKIGVKRVDGKKGAGVKNGKERG